jgi:uncharacterized protein
MKEILKCVLQSGDPRTSLEELPETQEYERAMSEILIAIRDEHILSAKEVKSLTGDAAMYLEEALEDSLQNITLEVTEQCNLRCKYCIYQDSHYEYREFGKKNMSWDVANAAIDYLKKHSGSTPEPNIGFYGGEPLINFALIKRAVEYTKETFEKDVAFSLTTNATLMTDEIAEFLAENGFSPIVSLDGPKILHDANRVLIDGRGSFDATMSGLDKLVNAYAKLNATEKIGFNIVVSGPDFDKDYDMIQDFLNSDKRIPPDAWIMTSFVDNGPQESEYILPNSQEDMEYMKYAYEPNYDWEDKMRRQGRKDKRLFVDGTIDKGMLIIHKRLLLDEPCQDYGMNGCCVPGQRRIYVTVDGRFLICEKVGKIPSIGNIHEGLNLERIRKYYVDDFVNEATQYCKNCWAINLCTLCYVNCYDENGTHFTYRHESCLGERKYIEENLIRYHTILEENPDLLEHYNCIELI